MTKCLSLLMLFILVLAGCSQSEAAKKQPFDIIGASTSIGGVDQTFDKQKLTFNFDIQNKDNLVINEDSIKTVLSDWTKKRVIENKVTEVADKKGAITVKGYIVFDSNGLTKEEIIKQKPLIKGIEITTKNGKQNFANYTYHQ